MKQPYNMTDQELSDYLAHNEDDAALEEWTLRRECRQDGRVAQGLGCAVGRDNDPS